MVLQASFLSLTAESLLLDLAAGFVSVAYYLLKIDSANREERLRLANKFKNY